MWEHMQRSSLRVHPHNKTTWAIPGIPASYPCDFSFGLPRGMVSGGSKPSDKGWGGRAGHPDHEMMGGSMLKKNFFRPVRPQLGLKITGGASPGSATGGNRLNGQWPWNCNIRQWNGNKQHKDGLKMDSDEDKSKNNSEMSMGHWFLLNTWNNEFWNSDQGNAHPI